MAKTVPPFDPNSLDSEVVSDSEHEEDDALDEVTEDSDLSNPNRRIWVVTTAALPWRTGTAVNPLLRALYLTRGRPKGYVTLIIPWVDDLESRIKLYGKDHPFSDRGQEEQEEWIRDFCRERANCEKEEESLRIRFYPASYHEAFGSIFPSVDICSIIPDDEADIAILEEPEHLNWFRVPQEEETSSQGGGGTTNDGQDEEATKMEKELGWAHKFRHVVGILHTNYSAYMTQYALGTSFVAAPAISMLSSIVARAYCHKVIRLSAVLPSLAPHKEVTCNVHGVRSEFLLPPGFHFPPLPTQEEPTAPVYFIGKLIWAKGFDKVLQIQDLYRDKTGAFFPIDVYGGGNDERAIKRAFWGRNNATSDKTTTLEDTPNEITSPKQMNEELRLELFESNDSLRSLLSQDSEGDALGRTESLDADEHHKRQTENDRRFGLFGIGLPAPLAILGDLSGKSVATAVSTSQAVYSLADSIVNAGLKMALTWEEARDASCSDKQKGTPFFDPPQSKYEWRRNPIPARFLGVKDHALVREIPQQKVFLNASTTEVLCTTTAEALAMGKFAIVPKHPSNEFFFQFPNCLGYESLDECVEKLRFALANEPQPLSTDLAYKFTWEGAKNRLYLAGSITRREMNERVKSGMEEADRQAAFFHVDSAKKGQFIANILSFGNTACHHPNTLQLS